MDEFEFDTNEPSDVEKETIRAAIIGLSMADAEKLYPDEKVREAIKNGIELDLEEDLQSDRANVETKDGKVVKVLYWG